MVEARRGREHNGASTCDTEHVLQMHGAQRSFAGYEDELSPLLERYVRCTLDERPRRARGDCGEGTHRAGAHHHPAAPRRARGWARATIAVVEDRDELIPTLGAHSVSKRLDVGHIRFGAQQAAAMVRDDQP